jgi:hypothetical protein
MMYLRSLSLPAFQRESSGPSITAKEPSGLCTNYLVATRHGPLAATACWTVTRE